MQIVAKPLTPIPPGSPFKWTIAGSVFADYSYTATTATLTPFTSDSFATVEFYWSDVGDGLDVSVTFGIGLSDCTKTVQFNVKDPVVTFPSDPSTTPSSRNPPPIGTIQLMGPNQIVLCKALAPPSSINDQGILFNAQVDTPPGFAPGEWQYGQTVNGDTRWKWTTTCDGMSAAAPVNDMFPYHAGLNLVVPPYATGTANWETDSPNFGVLAGMSQVKRYGGFQMYIMFLPAVGPHALGPSKWVPLRRCDWAFEYCADTTTGVWKVKDLLAPFVIPWFDFRIHPVWSNRWILLPQGPVACPGPC